MTKHYVYRLLDAGGQLLYVGRTTRVDRRKRAFEKRTGLNVTVGAVDEFECFETASDAERAAIVALRPPHNKLVASARGNLGMAPTEAHRMKVSAANRGRVLSEEIRADMSQRFKGRHVSEETRAKISEARRGQSASEQARANMSAAGKGRPKSPEHRANIAAARIGLKLSPEALERRRAAMLAKG